MGALNGLLWLASSALDANQNALNVTANNVANQNTPGYTREVADFSATDSVSLNGYATGTESVSSKAVSQRDRVLEQALQQQTAAAAQTSSRLTGLQSVQSVFGLSSTSTDASSTTLGTAIDSFFASLTSLSANPTDSATRQGVLTAAQNLAGAFNGTAQALSSETDALNSQVATDAGQVNGLTASIAALNGQIASVSPGTDAGTLEDQRQQDIKQLSGLLGVNQIATENNGVTLTTSSGAVLVSGGNAYAVSTTTSGGKTEVVAGDPPTAQTTLQGGAIGGALAVRDQDLPAVTNSIDQLAYALGSAVNAQNQAGLTPSGGAGAAIFTLPSSSAGAAAGISVALPSADGIANAASGQGATGTGNASALAGLGSGAVVGGESAATYFASIVGGLGDTVSSATAANTAASTSLSQAQTARDSLSAVSLDQEASSLTQYQRAYEAAAKVFTIANQILSDAINLGQATTVS